MLFFILTRRSKLVRVKEDIIKKAWRFPAPRPWTKGSAFVCSKVKFIWFKQPRRLPLATRGQTLAAGRRPLVPPPPALPLKMRSFSSNGGRVQLREATGNGALEMDERWVVCGEAVEKGRWPDVQRGGGARIPIWAWRASAMCVLPPAPARMGGLRWSWRQLDRSRRTPDPVSGRVAMPHSSHATASRPHNGVIVLTPRWLWRTFEAIRGGAAMPPWVARCSAHPLSPEVAAPRPSVCAGAACSFRARKVEERLRLGAPWVHVHRGGFG